MGLSVLIFAFLIVVVSGCPGEELIRPCTCRDSAIDSRSYLRCDGIHNEQQLAIAMKAIVGKQYIYSVTIENSAMNYIPSNTFEGALFKKLEIVNTSLTSLTDTDVAFEGLEDHLETFTMMGVTIMGYWDWTILSHLKKLSFFGIMDGDLEALDQLDDINTESLKHISLTDNQINYIDDNAFVNCINLASLTLDNNRISEMKRSMFPDPAPHFVTFSIRFNSIKHFPTGMFDNMPALKMLHIGFNRILSLEENVFAKVWPQLQYFEALGNELRCDCRLNWILKEKPTRVDATCFQPGRLEGKNLLELTAQDLWC